MCRHRISFLTYFGGFIPPSDFVVIIQCARDPGGDWGARFLVLWRGVVAHCHLIWLGRSSVTGHVDVFDTLLEVPTKTYGPLLGRRRSARGSIYTAPTIDNGDDRKDDLVGTAL